MMSPRLFYPMLAFLGYLIPNSFAELQFENPVSEHRVQKGAPMVQAVFRFTNQGKEPITIHKIASTCACLRAEADEKTYAPGATGTIEADFSIKGQSGLFEKSITVMTDSRAQRSILLKVQARIQDIITIEPKMTAWAANDAPTAKRVSFIVNRTKPIHVLSVSSSRSNVSATLHTVEEGRHYEIELTPTEAKTKMIGVVKIVTDCEIGSERNQLAFFRIEDSAK